MELQQHYYVHFNVLMSETQATTVNAEARPRRKHRGQAKNNEAKRVTSFKTEQWAAKAETGKKTASGEGSCPEDYITECITQ